MKCALIYDFDGTLAEGDCAQHGLMPALNINDISSFWQEVKSHAKSSNGDEILAYLGLLAKYASDQNSHELSISNLKKHGKKIPLFPGVGTWFDRIDKYAKDRGIVLHHYILSSGLDAMIQGTSIAHHFTQIFACKYYYTDGGNVARWPSQAINYTTKTQFLFRINKGIENGWDNEAVNRFIEPSQRPIPFERMIYFGDGDTDIPSMKMVKSHGGFSLAVFDSNKWNELRTQEKVGKLIVEKRANQVVPALYNEGSQLDVTVKSLLKLFKS